MAKFTPDPYEDLANAIIEQAAADYKKYLKGIKKLVANLDKTVYKFLNSDKVDKASALESIKSVDTYLIDFKEYVSPMLNNIDLICDNRLTIIDRMETIIDIAASVESNKKLDEDEKKQYAVELNRFIEYSKLINKYYYKAKSIESFFNSGYYGTLTTVDGTYMISKLKQEINNKEV